MQDPVFDLQQSISTLRWLLNLTTEFDRKDVRTRQAARLLDEYKDSRGYTNRENLEALWRHLEAKTAIPQADHEGEV